MNHSEALISGASTARVETNNSVAVTVPVLVALIVTEGFISIAMEILAIRKLVPYAGASADTTSWVITLFLASLSAGYYRGGQIKEKYFGTLLTNLIIVQVCLVIGMSSYTMVILDSFAQTRLQLLLTFLCLVICPATYFIGQTVPVLSNYFNEKTNGELSSKILASSTVGSCVGSIGTAVVMFNTLGVSHTISAVSVLCTAVIYYFSRQTKNNTMLLVSLILTSASVVVINNPDPRFVSPEARVILKKIGVSPDYENAYASSTVTEKGDTRILSQNRSFSSAIDDETGMSPYGYAVFIEKRIRARSEQNVLVIGAGGFTIGHTDEDNAYTFVDVDKDLKWLAEEKLLKSPINGRYINEGARPFLRKSEAGGYDVIVSDAYTNKHSIPAALVTQEYLLALDRALSDNGTVYFNVIMERDFSTPYARHMDDTLHSVFRCIAYDTGEMNAVNVVTNVVYQCRKRSERVVYTDDLTDQGEISQ